MTITSVTEKTAKNYEIALKNAALEGQVETIKKLLKSGIISKKARECATAFAAQAGHLGATEILLEKDSKQKLISKLFTTGHIGIVSKLLENGSFLNTDLTSTFKNAAKTGDLITTQSFLQHATIPKCTKIAAIKLAAKNNHLPVVESLLEESDILLSDVNKIFFTAIFIGDYKKVSTFLKKDDISEEIRGSAVCAATDLATSDDAPGDPEDYLTIMTRCLESGHISREDRGKAVCIAAEKNNTGIVWNLLRSSHDIFISPPDLTKIILWATQNKHSHILLKLLNNSDISEKDRAQAVLLAIKNHDVGSLLHLLKNGDISQEHRGEALCLASKQNDSFIVNPLLDGDPISAEHLKKALNDTTSIEIHKILTDYQARL